MENCRYQKSKPIIIVGAGISGLTVGKELSQRGFKVILIEKEDEIGGLAKSFRYEDFMFDIGPHRFFTTNPKINNYLQQFNKINYKSISRHSGVYLENRYYNWPLKPEVFLHLPLELTLRAGMDLLKKNRGDIPSGSNFKQYVKKAYGTTIYNKFFKDYNEKFFGLSNENIHSDWAKESVDKAIIDKKVSLRKLRDFFRYTFNLSSHNLKFVYPGSGIGSFCKEVGEFIKDNGGKILTNCEVESISFSKDKIKTVSFDNFTLTPHKVIWTGPLKELSKLFNIKAPSLNYLHLLIYNLELNTPVNKNYQWTYFGSKDICFNRITNPAAFSKNLLPSGKGSLCIEVTFNNINQSNNDLDPWSLVPEIIEGLKKVGYINSSKDIKAVHSELVKNAYPIYHLSYKKNLKRCLSSLSRFNNLFLNGRTGLFWYNNMDECIENSIKLVEDITLSN